MDEIGKSPADLLGAELLPAGNDDPNYADVLAALPPLRVPTFVGTRHSDEKPTYDYGGFSDEIYLDAGKIFTEIQDARNKHDVWEGLVGRWLPVVRFVFPAGEKRSIGKRRFSRMKGQDISGLSRSGIGLCWWMEDS